MEPNLTTQPLLTADQYYQVASDLIVDQNKTSEEAYAILTQKGMEPQKAAHLVTIIQNKKNGVVYDMPAEEGSNSGTKDMLIGGAWCLGGVIATVADLGYIFWGAIVFGGIQFIKGAMAKS